MNHQNQTFQYGSDLKLRWRDRDRYDKVNSINYLNFLEQIRHRYLSDVLKWDWDNYGILVEKVSVHHLSQLEFEDKPHISVACTEVSADHLILSYKIITNRDGEQILATVAETMLVAYEPKEKVKMKFDQAHIDTLMEYEGETVQVAQSN